MPKIIFEEDQLKTPIVQRRGGQFIVIFLILAFLMGGVGGAGSLVLLSSNTQLRRLLGVSDDSILNLTKTVQEKLVVEESNGFITTVKKSQSSGGLDYC